jgi:YNFM family putative membrane transporter
MVPPDYFRLQALVFVLVVAAFANLYLTQPVLPVIREEFGVSAATASLTVSAVILGISLANLPFGLLADRWPFRRLLVMGGMVVAGAGLVCAATASFAVLVAARFLQGLFLPALSTCVAAYLSRSLPPERLNVALGSYVSATVAGGLGGRLLGGWLHPPLHWRYAFVTAALVLVVAAGVAGRGLPEEGLSSRGPEEFQGFRDILRQRELRRTLMVAFGAFFVFSSSFNYLPFYLAAPPFNLPVQIITLMYLTYIMGIVIGPLAGKISNRLGNGAAMLGGATVFALALFVTLIPYTIMVALALVCLCAGFFTIHAAAAGSLNRRLSGGRGRANSLYVLFYYVGGAVGITLSGWAYQWAGWPGVVSLGLAVLAVPFVAGWQELREDRQTRQSL